LAHGAFVVAKFGFFVYVLPLALFWLMHKKEGKKNKVAKTKHTRKQLLLRLIFIQPLLT
jgi:hypothetical protein